MIHSVESRRSTGKTASFKSALEYILADIDSKKTLRDEVTILDGNPQMLMAVEQSMKLKQTFLHSTLAFTEKETAMLDENPHSIGMILQSYKDQLAVGLPGGDADRLNWTAVMHRDGDKIHIHCITLRADAQTGLSYQPFVVQRGDVKRFNAWNKVMQAEFGLENPNAWEHKRAFSINPHHPGASIKKQLSEYINELVAKGQIENRAGTIEAMAALDGVTIARQTKNSISIKIEGRPQNVRLTGAVFDESFRVDFDSKDTSRSASATTNQSSVPELQSRLSELSRQCNQGMGSRYETKSSSDNHGPGVGAAAGVRPGLVRQSAKRSVTDQSPESGLPDHFIFKSCTTETTKLGQAITWGGSYGSAQIVVADDSISLGKGNRMEWRMAAQMAKSQGWTAVGVVCADMAQARAAYDEARKAGITKVSIKINGKEIDMEDIKNEYNETIADRKTANASTRSREAGTPRADPENDRRQRKSMGNIHRYEQEANREIDGAIRSSIQHDRDVVNLNECAIQELGKGVKLLVKTSETVSAIADSFESKIMKIVAAARASFKEDLKKVTAIYEPAANTTRITYMISRLSSLETHKIDDKAIERMKEIKDFLTTDYTMTGKEMALQVLDGKMTIEEMGEIQAKQRQQQQQERPATVWASEGKHTGMHM